MRQAGLPLARRVRWASWSTRASRVAWALAAVLQAFLLQPGRAVASPAQEAATAQVLQEPFARTRFQQLPVVAVRPVEEFEKFFRWAELSVDKFAPVVGEWNQQYRTACFALEVPEGEIWEFVLSGQPLNTNAYPGSMQVKLGVGADCASPRTRWLAEGRNGIFKLYPNLLRVVSGGGAYVVRAQWTYPIGHRYQASEGVAQVDGRRMATGITAGRLPAGVVAGRLRRDLNGTAASQPAATPSATASLRPGTLFRDCPDCPDMRVLPAGNFRQGAPAFEEGAANHERPLHSVSLPAAFAMSTHEVTFAQFAGCVAAGICRAPDDAGWGQGDRPVINVSYLEAARFALWLSEKTGAEYFLPTESEWEYAARAGTETPWSTGDAILAEDANILGSVERTVPVGSYPANRFGLHDLHGNVTEWVRGCVDAGYFGVPDNGLPMLKGDCLKKVVRGGSFSSLPNEARSAARRVVPTLSLGPDIGFRLVRRL